MHACAAGVAVVGVVIAKMVVVVALRLSLRDVTGGKLLLVLV